MADHIWTVLCDKHLVDPRLETISLIDVVESINVPDLGRLLEEALSAGKRGALVKTPMLLVSWWFRSDPSETTLHVRFSIASPTGEHLFMQAVGLSWTKDQNHRRIFVNLDGIPVQKPGRSWFIVEQQVKTKKGDKLRWTVVARIPLEIN